MFTIRINKQEAKLLNWLRKAASKDLQRPVLTHLFVKNGKTVACDGFRLFTIPTPEGLREKENKVIQPVDKSLHADSLAEIIVCGEDDVPEQNYPDIGIIYPRGKPVFTIGVNAQFLKEALEIHGDSMVKLTFYSPTIPFLVTNKEEPDITALVMPMYLGDPEPEAAPF